MRGTLAVHAAPFRWVTVAVTPVMVMACLSPPIPCPAPRATPGAPTGVASAGAGTTPASADSAGASPLVTPQPPVDSSGVVCGSDPDGPPDWTADPTADARVAASDAPLFPAAALQQGSTDIAFGQYLASVHTCLHPVFAKSFLDSLEPQPDDPLSNKTLVAAADLLIDGHSGALTRVRLRRHSGSAAFDRAALIALLHSFPVQPVPPEVVSSDGNVYLLWELHRDRDEACSTYFARLFKLPP